MRNQSQVADLSEDLPEHNYSRKPISHRHAMKVRTVLLLSVHLNEQDRPARFSKKPRGNRVLRDDDKDCRWLICYVKNGSNHLSIPQEH